jgi:type IV pilus assembly protein PilA
MTLAKVVGVANIANETSGLSPINWRNTMKAIQKGFTLIELMIVVAIIAILAAIAIPAYQDFIVRSRVTELVNQGGACKTSVEEFWTSKGRMPDNQTEAGCTLSNTENAAPPAVANTGIITILAKTGSPLASKIGTDDLVYAPFCGVATGAVAACPTIATAGLDVQEWRCTQAVGTSIAARYLPATCR